MLSFQTFGRALREGGYDFTSYLLSSEAFWSGNNPYLTGSPYPYIYPLFLTVVLIPFTFLPAVLADSLFLLLNIILLFYSFITVVKYYVKEKLLPVENLALPFLALTIFLLEVIQNNLLNGQINIIVLFLTILFLVFYLKEKPIESSIFLSMAIAIKLTPLIFLFFLIKRKEYKIVSLTILFSFLFIFGLPYLIQGSNTVEFYQYYFNKVKDLSFAENLKPKTKIFTLNDFISFLIPVLKETILFKILCAAAVIVILFIMDKGKSFNGPRKEILIFSIYSAGILLITPMSETHHIIVILSALSIITYNIFFKFQVFTITGIILLSLFIISFLSAALLNGTLYFISFVLLITLIFSIYKVNYDN